MMRVFVVKFIAILAAMCCAAPLQAKNYELAVEFFPDKSILSGEALIWLKERRLDDSNGTFFLHGELRVTSIEMNGKAVDYSENVVFFDNEYSLVALKVDIDLSTVGEDVTGPLRIKYKGPFHASAVRSPSDYMRIDHDGVFLRSYGYSVWFPIFLGDGNFASTADFQRVALTTPEKFTAVFAGELMSESREKGKTTTVWRAVELALYAAQVTARPFEIRRTENVDFYGLTDFESRSGTSKINDYVQSLLGIYRIDFGEPRTSGKTIVAQMPAYGNIASGNMVGVSDDIWREFDGAAWYGRTLAHELVHDFVYVSTPEDDPFYAIAKEGFPDYFFLPAFAQLFGETYYTDYLDRIEAEYIDKVKTGKGPRGNDLPEQKPLTSISGSEIGVYKDVFLLNDRCRLFFDYMRRKMGPENFREFMKDVMSQRRLTRDDFYALLESSYPDIVDDARVWLETIDFPDKFRRNLE